MIHIRQKAKPFAALFAACFLLALSGCQNPVQPPVVGNEPTGTGTLSLTIARPGLARTILPGAPIYYDFAAFRLAFVHYSDTGLDFYYEHWDGDGTIQVPVGTWDLTLTAYLQGNEYPVPVAAGTYKALQVGEGFNTADIFLRPLSGGEGRFEWDITVPGNIVSAGLEIFLYTVPLPAVPVHSESFDNVDGAIYGAHTLSADRYLVIFRLYDGSNEGVVELIEILHVYRNMISLFDPDFTVLDFPASLLGEIARAWNGASFGGLAVNHGHFGVLGIEGVTAGNFADIVNRFAHHYPAALAEYFPHTLERLKILVDAALIGVARHSFLDGNYDGPGNVVAAIPYLIMNDSYIDGIEPGQDYVTVQIGNYSVAVFYAIPGANLAERLRWLRLNALDGGSYLVRINGDETLTPTTADTATAANIGNINAPQMLPTGRNLTITLRGAGTGDIVRLPTGAGTGAAFQGNLFRIQSGVTLILDNVTLVGRSGPRDATTAANYHNNNHLVRINNGGTLIVNADASVTGNTAQGAAAANQGGGVRVNSGGTFILNGGEISGHSLAGTAPAGLIGAGVRVEDGGRFYMLGGIISDNIIDVTGTGVDNAGQAGGVWVAPAGFTAGAPTSGGFFRMSGGRIPGVDYDDASLRNIAVHNAASLLHVGNTAEFGSFTGVFDGRTAGSLGDFVPRGNLRTSNLTINVADGERIVQARSGNFALQLDWVRSFARDGYAYTIEISADENFSPDLTTLPVGMTDLTVILTSAATGVTRSVGLLDRANATASPTQGPLFNIPSGVTLVLNDITLVGRSGPLVAAQNTSPLVLIGTGGTLRMNDGATITGNINNTADSGGGVSVSSGGMFEMRGGAISGNIAQFGGGVFVSNGGAFRISGGTVHGNEDTVSAELRNTTRDGAGASLGNLGTTQFGTFDGTGHFSSTGCLGTNNRTITVTGGVFDIPPRLGDTDPLADRLAWLLAFDVGDDDITFYLHDNESLSPVEALLPVGNRTITFIGVGGNRSISLSANGVLFTVNPGTTLVLEDVTLVGRRVGGNGNANNNNHLVRVNDGGTLLMHAGSAVTGNNNTSTVAADLGGGVRVNAGGTFILDGGEISGNTAGATATSAGGVHVAAGGTFEMLSGEISGNSTSASTSAGGVIVVGGVAGSGIFNMRGGEISGNTSTAGAIGAGGVMVHGAPAIHAFFNMYGGTISGNSASTASAAPNIAGGVRVGGTGAGSTFNMRGGTISDNEATAVANAAGGVNVGSANFFRISDGVIYGIDATADIMNASNNGSAALLRGTAATGAWYGTFDNDGEFIPAASGGVLANIDFTVEVINGVLTVPNEPPATETVLKRLAWHRAFGQGNENVVIEISANESLTPTQAMLPAGRTVILRGVGVDRSISLAGNGALFTVGGTGAAGTILVLENVALVGHANNNSNLVRVEAGGTLRLNDESRITGNTSSGTAASLGGGVRVAGTYPNVGTLILDGGEISGNTATGATTAGGVHIAAGGVVNIIRGRISNNRASGITSAGGVILTATGAANPAVLNMHGGAISGNESNNTGSQANAAGGVRVGGTGNTFNMRGGVIYGNDTRSTAATASGGVSVLGGGAFRISDGIIRGSDAATGANTVPDTGWAALFRTTATTGALSGMFFDDYFFQMGVLENSDYTIEVVDGEAR